MCWELLLSGEGGLVLQALLADLQVLFEEEGRCGCYLQLLLLIVEEKCLRRRASCSGRGPS